jgi:protein-tyrosine-phosphatase
VLKLTDPGQKFRIGFSLGVGATKGKDLFDGVDLMAKYFFDAVGAKYTGSLNYRQVEAPGDILEHPTAIKDVRQKAGELMSPFMSRKRVLFLCTENACRSQMASAFARLYAGDRLDCDSAGSAPAEVINSVMIEAMAEKGIDMAYQKPKSLEDVTGHGEPDLIVTMGCGDVCPMFPGVKTVTWDLPDPAGEPIDFMRQVRDEIEKKVKELITTIE